MGQEEFPSRELAGTEGSSVANERCSPTRVIGRLVHPKTSSEHEIFLWAEVEHSWTYALYTDPGPTPSFATGAVTYPPIAPPHSSGGQKIY